VSTKRALLVGIDAYAHIRTLDGCVNDSRLMRSLLVDRFGFPADHVIQLLDAQATRQAILAAFDSLVTATGPDDVVVIHFAGHGSQMRDREGDEPSGFDSTLMPWDTGRGPHENRDITDDEIHVVLAALAVKTRHITVLVDACHSGTVTRDAFGAKTRSVERDLRPIEALPPSPVAGGRLALTPSGASGWLPLGDNYVLIAGCRDEEESKEYFPPEGGGPHGALTYFLSQALQAATSTTTYRDVFEHIAARVTAYNAVQHPQIEGTADKTVFGVDDLPPVPFVAVTGRDGQTAHLAAGQALGITVGTTFAVHAAGTKRPAEGDALGELLVRSVSPFTAEASIVRESGDGAITAGARAFVTSYAFGDLALPVQFASPAATAAFAEALAASPFLKVVPEEAAAAARIYLLPARSRVEPGDPVPQAGALDTERWAVVDATGALLMPLKSPGDEKTVVQNLDKVAKARRVLALDNPSPGELAGAVTLDLLKKTATGGWVPATPDVGGVLPVVDEGQRVQFRVTNRGKHPIAVAMIYVGTGSQISVPKPFTLAPETSDGSLAGPVSFPPNYPFTDLGDPLRGVDSVETAKLIVTMQPVDFSGLREDAMRSGAVSPSSPTAFGVAMQRLSGARRRGFSVEPEPDAATRQAWTTVSKSLIVRRRSSALGSAAPAAIGHAVVSAPAITGLVSTGRTSEGRDETAGFATSLLQQALAGADVAMRQTLAIDAARPTSAATRSADGSQAPIAVQLAPPPDGHGQMVLASDELGLVSWSFARSTPGARSLSDRATSRTYHVPSAVPDTATGQPASRGLIGIVGRKVIKELVFPILKPMLGSAGASAVQWLETTRWPYRVRTFTPDDYTAADAPSIDRDGWRRLSGGRALLMVHGTFSRSHLAFAALPADVVATLHRQYDGRVFAFDHLFLSEDPAENVRWLVSQLPDDADLTLDIVCHSRGGLVSRVLAEKQGELSLGSRRIRVGKVVLVGVPNAGTALADPAHVETLLDVFSNLINLVPDGTGAPVLSMIVEFAKLAAIGALDALSGLRAMHPAGDFMRRLNAPAAVGDTRYFAVASNVAPVDPGLRHFLRSRALTALLRGGNDLVVPSDGAFGANGASLFPVADPLLLEGDAAVSHTKYFADPRVRDQVMSWLASS
jgi:Caspase domain